MAITKAISSKAGIGTAIDYVMNEEKTKENLISGIGCTPALAKEEMRATKELWGKTGGREYKHFTISYAPGENITAEKAHINAKELIENTSALEGYEMIVVTHTDKEHIHTHIIANSVSYVDGKKLQWSKYDLKKLKERTNKQSLDQGLHVPEKGKTFEGADREETVAWSKDTYQLLKKAEDKDKKIESYVTNCAYAVLDCMELATSKEDFIEKMNEKGYEVAWSDNRKHITFTDKERKKAGEKKCKIRANRIESYFGLNLGKEDFLNEFEVNKARKEKYRGQLMGIVGGTEPENNGVGNGERCSETGIEGSDGKERGVAREVSGNDEKERSATENNTGTEGQNRQPKFSTEGYSGAAPSNTGKNKEKGKDFEK